MVALAIKSLLILVMKSVEALTHLTTRSKEQEMPNLHLMMTRFIQQEVKESDKIQAK